MRILVLVGMILSSVTWARPFEIKDVLLVRNDEGRLRPMVVTHGETPLTVHEIRHRSGVIEHLVGFDGSFTIDGTSVVWNTGEGEYIAGRFTVNAYRRFGAAYLEIEWAAGVRLSQEDMSTYRLFMPQELIERAPDERALEDLVFEISKRSDRGVLFDTHHFSAEKLSPALRKTIRNYLTNLRGLLIAQRVPRVEIKRVLKQVRKHLLWAAPYVDALAVHPDGSGPLTERLELLLRAFLFTLERFKTANPDDEELYAQQALGVLSEIILIVGRTQGSHERKKTLNMNISSLLALVSVLAVSASPLFAIPTTAFLVHGLTNRPAWVRYPGTDRFETEGSAATALDTLLESVEHEKLDPKGPSISQLLELFMEETGSSAHRTCELIVAGIRSS